jgi:hypothetical protein
MFLVAIWQRLIRNSNNFKSEALGSRGSQIIIKSGGHVKIQGARRMPLSRLSAKGSEILGATVQNLVVLY